jgi:hypothetical protein
VARDQCQLSSSIKPLDHQQAGEHREHRGLCCWSCVQPVMLVRAGGPTSLLRDRSELVGWGDQPRPCGTPPQRLLPLRRASVLLPRSPKLGDTLVTSCSQHKRRNERNPAEREGRGWTKRVLGRPSVNVRRSRRRNAPQHLQARSKTCCRKAERIRTQSRRPRSELAAEDAATVTAG